MKHKHNLKGLTQVKILKKKSVGRCGIMKIRKRRLKTQVVLRIRAVLVKKFRKGDAHAELF